MPPLTAAPASSTTAPPAIVAQIDSGLASGAVIFAGSQVVRSAGTAIGTAVSGGTEMVSSGGTTSNTLLVSGQETVLRGGHASGTIITSGATRSSAAAAPR
jgi:autotransporter passenger strand-loop-strand repeat protein